MKRFRLLKAIVLMMTVVAFNCSGGSDDPPATGNNNNNGNTNGNNNNVTSLSLTTVNSSDCGLFAGDTVTFTVTTNTNQDVTSSAAISVDGQAISGNTYTPANSGSYNVVATYQNVTSNTAVLDVSDALTRFTKNVLIEDYTGTWCPFCPRVSYAKDLVKQQTSQVAMVSVHDSDQFEVSAGIALHNAFNVSSWPTVKLDRTADWMFPEPENVDQIIDRGACPEEAGIAITPTQNGNSLTIEVRVKFGETFTMSNTKLTVFLLEDNLIGDQRNNTSYYGGADPIVGYEHDGVLRASLTNVTGDVIPSSGVMNSVYTRTFTLNVPSNISNASNMSVVASISNDNFIGSPVSVNSRVANFGDTQSFQEL